jgi:hypothetical protein
MLQIEHVLVTAMIANDARRSGPGARSAANFAWTVVPGHNGAEYALVRTRTRRRPSMRAELTSTRSNPSLGIGSR